MHSPLGQETVKKRAGWRRNWERHRAARELRRARIQCQFTDAHLRGTFPQPAPRERVRDRFPARAAIRRWSRLRSHRGRRFRLHWVGPGRRPVEPDWLRLLCDCLEELVRVGEWFAEDLPHIFGPHAPRLQAEAAAQARFECELADALDKVYGPPPPGSPPHPRPTMWSVLVRTHGP